MEPKSRWIESEPQYESEWCGIVEEAAIGQFAYLQGGSMLVYPDFGTFMDHKVTRLEPTEVYVATSE